MRLPNAEHKAGPWRIRGIAHDFVLEDVWALPAEGSAEDFDVLIDLLISGDPANGDSSATRLLWRTRSWLGDLLGWDDEAVALPIPGCVETSLSTRLPDELRGTATDLSFASLPFTALYRTDREFAAEISNRTVHGVMHLAWVEHAEGLYSGQMAVYVLPRGQLGRAYMALIKPFRHVIVYPALMRQTARMWDSRTAGKPTVSGSAAP